MADRLRVVFASHLAGLCGGAERSLFDIAVGLKKDGRIEPIVTVPEEGSLASGLRAESIPVFVLPTPWWVVTPRTSRLPLLGPARKARRAVAFAPSLVAWSEWLSRQRPDLLVTNTAVIGTPAVAGKLTRVPHVWWLHEFVTKDHRMSYALGETLAQRTIGRLSTYVIANSMAVRDHFSPPIPARKMHVMYQGIAGFSPAANRVEPSTALAGPPRLRALVLCTLVPSKGVEVALEAAHLLAAGRAGASGAGRPDEAYARAVDLRLRLVGSAPPLYRQILERRVADLGLQQVVEIKEATPTPQEELDWTNVLLVCSDSEAFGRVTVEALMSGRPVVGTRSGGTAELVSHGANGLLVPPGDAEALASALSALAYDPALLGKMSEEAVAGTRGRFTMEQQVESMAALLMQAAAKGRRRQGRWPR